MKIWASSPVSGLVGLVGVLKICISCKLRSDVDADIIGTIL